METADQLLISTQSANAIRSKEKLHCIAEQLRLLLNVCLGYIDMLQRGTDTQQVRI